MDPTDEFFHDPGDEEAWSESHYFHFVDEDVQGHGRIGFYPNRGVANVWAFLCEGETIYWVADERVPPSEVHGLAARRDDYIYAHHPLSIGQEWRIEWSGTARQTTNPTDVLADAGEPTTVDLDLILTDRHDLFYYSDGVAGSPHEGADDRYEVTCDVTGDVTVNGREIDVSGPGQRDHSWAPREWAGDAEWLYISGGFENGTAYHHTTAWLAGFPGEPVYQNGYWFDGSSVEPLTDATVRADPQFGRDTARAWSQGDEPTFQLDLTWDGGATVIDVEPFVTTPIEFVNEGNGQRSLFNRSAFRQETTDGTTGTGWLENPTQFDLADA